MAPRTENQYNYGPQKLVGAIIPLADEVKHKQYAKQGEYLGYDASEMPAKQLVQ